MATLSVSTYAQESMIKHEIASGATGTVKADLYWPLEDSFWCLLPEGSDRVALDPEEINGIGGSAMWSNPDTPEYFPLLPDHMTQVSRSTAVIFGETDFDLAPSGSQVDRRANFDFTGSPGLTDENMLQEFGMHYKEDWTLHLIVSPDEDASDSRGWETLFEIGDPGYGLGPIHISVEVDKNASTTDFQVVTQAQGNTRTVGVSMSDSDVEYLNSNDSSHGRYWYQVIVQYYDHDTDPHKIRLIVNTIDASTGVVDTAIATANSNDYRHNDASISARLGQAIDGSQQYHGAMHHFAVWHHLIDTDYSATTELEDLADAFEHDYASPNPRSALSIDWSADPRFYIWDRPIDEDPLNISERNLWKWEDPIWDEAGVYPMVRFWSNRPSYSGTAANGDYRFNPPTLEKGAGTGDDVTFTIPSGETADDVANQTANWLEYLEAGMEYYTSKSLTDDRGNVVLMQNWGRENRNAGDFDIDLGASRALVRNWRDVPTSWRGASGPGEQEEAHIPFYREGMSINAFRSTEMFKELRSLIDTSSSDDINMPDRFHMDIEAYGQIDFAWDAGDISAGWWDAVDSAGSVSDDRIESKAFWTPYTGSRGYDTLKELRDNTTHAPDTADSVFSTDNNGFDRLLREFLRDQFDHAMGAGFILPIHRELSEDIRFSEYILVEAGDAGDNEQTYRGKPKRYVEDVDLQWLDFSSPVLYPIKTQKITPYSGSSDDTLYQEWGDDLGVSTMLNTPGLSSMARPYDNGSTLGDLTNDIEPDARTLFVELAKFQINATYLAGGGDSGRPQSPWLPYPDWDVFELFGRFDIDADGIVEYNGEDDTYNPVVWQDVARIACFAYRHGVREFIMWGDPGSVDNPGTVTGLENIFAAVGYVEDSIIDFSTEGASSSSLNYGVPDGCIGIADYNYFNAIYNAGDLEADISGSNGYPDGVVDTADSDEFIILYSMTCP